MKERGKHICETLKTIRKQVADANDIDYEPHECHHEGDCAGTCPACEAEVRYLERSLNLRRHLGKAVALVGISAGLLAFSGCGSKKVHHDVEEDLDGDVEELDGDVENDDLAGMPVIDDEDDNFLKTDSLANDPASANFVDYCEEMPHFKGGDHALKKYLEHNLQWPDGVNHELAGIVIVKVIIETDGTISNATVIRSLHPALDKEAVRVVNAMPKWEPGKQDGKLVRTSYTIPVRFNPPS